MLIIIQEAAGGSGTQDAAHNDCNEDPFGAGDSVLVIPHVEQSTGKRRSASRSGKTAVLTASPYIAELKEQKNGKTTRVVSTKRSKKTKDSNTTG